MEGLSLFSKPSRIALIYAVKPEDPLRIYDPQGLLSGHDPKLKKIYIDSGEWQTECARIPRNEIHNRIFPRDNLHLAGLISYGGSSSSMAYQMWFTEHHPDICSTAPIERWLEQAVWLLSRDVTAEESFDGTSGHVLRHYSLHAVHDCIVDERNLILGWDTRLRVYTLLDAILKISRTPEEGSWPRGKLVFAEPSQMSRWHFLTRFPEEERPFLQNTKHVRKLLQAVENSGRKLASDGTSIVGITEEHSPEAGITASFDGRYGFVHVGEKAVCSFSDGSFHASTRLAKLVEIEEALLDSDLPPALSQDMFKIISSLVHYAEKRKHGGSIVVDLGGAPLKIPGHRLIPPLDLTDEKLLGFAKSLIKIDGAVQITSDLKLHGFGCLLDGIAIRGENMARGARFNSALRFSASHDQVIIIVISADRTVSILKEGIELTAQCVWNPVSGHAISPPTLKKWLE